MRTSFYERLWDLQSRKCGQERLKARLTFERVAEKLRLNSCYGKIAAKDVDKIADTSFFDSVFKARKKRIEEIVGLQREFRLF